MLPFILLLIVLLFSVSTEWGTHHSPRLAIGEARRGRVLGDALGDAGDGQLVVGIGAEGHTNNISSR